MLPLQPSTFEALSRHLHKICGLVLTPDKSYLIHHRLEPIVSRLGLTSYEELLDRLVSSGHSALRDDVIQAITTHETAFFRDAHAFHALRHTVLPELLRTALRRRQALDPRPYLNIWCAAVSTGQEAYSVAMHLDDLLHDPEFESLRLADFRILATDISSHMIDEGLVGIYSAREVERSVSLLFQQRYFRPNGSDAEIASELRQIVEFRQLNLIDESFVRGPFDLILCRNVLIYFDDPTRRRICERFHHLLRPNGTLMLGAAENLYGVTEHFDVYFDAQAAFYRRK